MEDNIETIVIECIWQILDVKLSDGLFDLPISIYIRHPLRFTVAHRHHGMQLRSAWANPHPTSIEEHDPTKDNMSIEASVVNYCKSNFSEDDYPAIKKDLLDNFNLSKQWYDPSLRPQETQEAPPRDPNQSSVILAKIRMITTRGIWRRDRAQCSSISVTVGTMNTRMRQ